jgi:hypothetical protein
MSLEDVLEIGETVSPDVVESNTIVVLEVRMSSLDVGRSELEDVSRDASRTEVVVVSGGCFSDDVTYVVDVVYALYVVLELVTLTLSGHNSTGESHVCSLE